MPATATGWVMYGSPLLRVCPACAERADVVGAQHARHLLFGQVVGGAPSAPARTSGSADGSTGSGARGRGHRSGRAQAPARRQTATAAARRTSSTAAGVRVLRGVSSAVHQVVAALRQVVVDFGGGPLQRLALLALALGLVDLVD